MRVLVTGGAGFIGGNLVRALASRGDEVVVLDNLATYHSLDAIGSVLDRVRFVHGDVRCEEDFARVGSGPFERVYHLAASFANELSVEHPAIDARCNVAGTRHAVAFAREAGCGLFVYAGSSSSYGDAPPPVDEGAPLRPQTPYARSKHEGEACALGSGLRCAVLRLFNVYGPGDPPGRYRNAIPNMMQALDQPGGRMRVFGEDSTRDFTYVDDVVRVLLDADRAGGHVVNVGSGVETSIVALARQILALFGLPEERLSIEPQRPWDRVTRRCARVDRLEQLVGYVPRTPLAEGLRRTALWLREAGYIGLGVS